MVEWGFAVADGLPDGRALGLALGAVEALGDAVAEQPASSAVAITGRAMRRRIEVVQSVVRRLEGVGVERPV
jgi:hypothetical protein